MKYGVILVLVAITALALAETLGQSKKELTYTKDVAPVIKSYCIPCHLEENENPSGLALDDYEKILKGGNHGSTVVPRKPQESYLYLKILPNPPFGKQMARNKKKLTEEETKTIYDWIAQGAKK
jgi:hypothetical protein